MKDTAKKLMPVSYNYYKEIEQKLEDYAKNGLVLTKIGGIFWTFKKTEPQNLKYTVTYFDEGSVFNPHPTENQLTFFEYAEAVGWDFVCEYGKMQIFSSSLEYPAPFETDEGEKLLNIHKCMKKSFVSAQIMMLVLWVINLLIKIDSLLKRPSDFLSSNLDLLALVMFFSITVFTVYTLTNYYSWYYKSKKSVSMGGKIISAYSKIKKVFERIYVVVLLLLAGYMFFELFKSFNYGVLILSLIQIPLFILVFQGSIKLLKKLKIAARATKIVSYCLLFLTFFLYLSIVFGFISNFNLEGKTNKPYTTVDWEVSAGETWAYRLYQDTLPLTCEDLYGDIDFQNYSYEEKLSSSVLLKKAEYSQTAVPMKNPPPEIEYTIFTPKFKFVSDMLLGELTSLDKQPSKKIEALDNSIFGTLKAYSYYYLIDGQKSYNGEYLLVFKDSIIDIKLAKPPADAEIETVKEKLLIE